MEKSACSDMSDTDVGYITRKKNTVNNKFIY